MTYSFIIPHHNSPELLNRCLDTIPQREDIQIIVVDDNSKAELRPTITRSDVEVIYIDAEHTKGAGHARNVGIERARGKWLLFADCDDYYSDRFIDVLDDYNKRDIDVLYYNYEIIDEGINKVPDCMLQTILQKEFRRQEDVDFLRYCNNPPWNKMVLRDLISTNNIRFEEVENGNDILFSLLLALHSKKTDITRNRLYNYLITPNSLGTKRQTVRGMLCRLEHRIKYNNFLKKRGYTKWKKSLFYFNCILVKNYGFVFCLKVNSLLLKRIYNGNCDVGEWTSLNCENC